MAVVRQAWLKDLSTDASTGPRWLPGRVLEERIPLAKTSAPGLYRPLIVWSCLYTVNLLKQLFSRHRHAQKTSHALVNWLGESGKKYPYKVYPIHTSFRPLPGNFIYAYQAEEGSWIPIYIAQTRDMHQRLEGHVRVETAIENGATHIHAHYNSDGQAARCTEERDLILRWHPACNDF